MADMRLIGSKFTELNSKRNPNFSGKLSMSTNIRVKDMEQTKEMKDAMKIAYEFKVDYDELGSVSIEGEIFVQTDSKTIKSLQKSWKEKKFDSPEHLAITNLIIQKASIKAFELEEELGLPIHIRLPTLSPKKKE